MLNASQVNLGNVVMLSDGEKLRVVGGVYGTSEYYCLINEDKLVVEKAETLEELLEDKEIVLIAKASARVENMDFEADREIEEGTLFMALVAGQLEVREIIGYEDDEEKFFAIDPRTGERKTRTKKSAMDVVLAYDVTYTF